jgi:hypothetical protein
MMGCLKMIEVDNFLIKDIKKYLKMKNKIKIVKNKRLTKKEKYIITVINEMNLEKRYGLIYDYICNYLDEDMQRRNFCDFKEGKCIASRKRKTVHEFDGCCWERGIGHCYHLSEDKRCKIRSISCKLFVCNYLESKGIKYNIKKLFPVKYFLNRKQINILKSSYFKSKEETISRLLKTI